MARSRQPWVTELASGNISKEEHVNQCEWCSGFVAKQRVVMTHITCSGIYNPGLHFGKNHVSQ